MTIEHTDALFAQHDTDKSGKISTDEFEDILKKLKPKQSKFDIPTAFAKWDKDGDGQISKFEFRERIQKIRQEHPDWLHGFDTATVDHLRKDPKFEKYVNVLEYTGHSVTAVTDRMKAEKVSKADIARFRAAFGTD